MRFASGPGVAATVPASTGSAEHSRMAGATSDGAPGSVTVGLRWAVPLQTSFKSAHDIESSVPYRRV